MLFNVVYKNPLPPCLQLFLTATFTLENTNFVFPLSRFPYAVPSLPYLRLSASSHKKCFRNLTV